MVRIVYTSSQTIGRWSRTMLGVTVLAAAVLLGACADGPTDIALEGRTAVDGESEHEAHRPEHVDATPLAAERLADEVFPGQRVEVAERRDLTVPDGSIPIERVGVHHWTSEPIPDADFASYITSGIGFRVEGDGDADLSYVDWALVPEGDGWVLEGTYEVESVEGTPVLRILSIQLDGIVYED